MIALATRSGFFELGALLGRVQWPLMTVGIVVSSFVTYSLPPRSCHVLTPAGAYTGQGRVWFWTAIGLLPLALALNWLRHTGLVPLHLGGTPDLLHYRGAH